MPHEWVFDELPSSGARRGGDPAEHVFKHDIDTFVREVVQNANDQRDGSPNVDFAFKLYEGEELAAFLEHLHYAKLAPHLSAASSAPSARRLKQTLVEVETRRRLLVLRVTDRNTVGLTGDEDSDASHFRALCKDVLVSHKNTASAGGSYGLGKSVLWAFSGLSTVAFNSIPKTLPEQTKGPPRFIARTELPSHRVANREFAGPGWFGTVAQRDKGQRAESIWGLTANTIARDLGMPREQLDSGTTILVIGFREPAADDPSSVSDLSDRLREAATRWFWPAMDMEGRSLGLSIDATRLDATKHRRWQPFVECHRSRRTTRTTLEDPGDTVVRDIPIEVPAQHSGESGIRGEVRLIVRLAANDSSDEMLGRVAIFRGAGMVVKYLDMRSLAASTRQFHAVLAAGEARLPEAPTKSDRAVEQFLRLSEPPGHDEWQSTNALKETYQRGYAKAIDGMFARVKDALRELLAPKPESGTRAPDLLLKRFPFGAKGMPGSAPTSFHFSNVRGELNSSEWSFEGEIRPTEPGGRWTISIGLQTLGDGGARLGQVPIEAIKLADGPARAAVAIKDGRALVEVPRGTESIQFQGRSRHVEVESRSHAIELEVTGSRELET